MNFYATPTNATLCVKPSSISFSDSSKIFCSGSNFYSSREHVLKPYGFYSAASILYEATTTKRCISQDSAHGATCSNTCIPYTDSTSQTAHPGNPLLTTPLQTIISTAHLQQSQSGHQTFSLQQRTQSSILLINRDMHPNSSNNMATHMHYKAQCSTSTCELATTNQMAILKKKEK